ncbi:MAG: antitoxin [Polyangiaceae bacterium]|nr:antitoxin [Polyangiaceae bacterium]MCK6531489.1 CopG family transcriptional regulator [Polyangiaceae bacterium]
MRTTLTLDPDVAQLLKAEAHRQRKAFKEVVNDAIRRGLSPQRERPPKRYRVRPHKTRLLPGIDLAGFNKLADELEDDALIAKAKAPR